MPGPRLPSDRTAADLTGETRIENAGTPPTARNNRDRIIALEYAAAAIRADLRRLRSELEELAGQVDQVTKADEIAQAVTAAMDSSRRARFTFSRKLAGALAAAVLLLPALHDAYLWIR